ncbi:MAG: hypothetical protein A2Z24_02440 [Candidatus Woykebacteria bacterium RBG_16_44_10]|uniref:PIN domain-containing protein n=1 Tax=Candidatus Woykebacteria bacterium RBG_16_44_10 TaxID=1802597 RepID=A0A1G1WE37_9BACT|nr:MAG: hypothetical protein A2Z24_02440 [Candidatus Woykebacteria bacterium RBG_16_44_10]
MKLVLDASVILKLVLIQDEPHREKALEIIKNFQIDLVQIILPSFWKYEIGNILSTKEDNFADFYKFILNIGFSNHEFSNDELIEIGEFAKKYNVSFYDASYHILAKLTNSVFVTADEAYFDKAKKAGSIVLLRNLNLVA